jgi:hypothetical protein
MFRIAKTPQWRLNIRNLSLCRSFLIENASQSGKIALEQHLIYTCQTISKQKKS